MSFYSMYRIFKDIFKTIFGYKFWRKLLIMILIGVIVFFVLHNYGYCVEPDSSYNVIEPIGRNIGVLLDSTGKFVENANYNTYVYQISTADTYVLFFNGTEGRYSMTIGAGDIPITVGSNVTLLDYQTITTSGNYTYEFYNNGYTFLYVSYRIGTDRELTVYQQMYSTYIKPLVTPTHAVFSVSDSQVINVGGTDTYYFNAFQINKGFNYKVSGISSDLNFYYTSELNQIDASGYEWYYYQTNSTTSTKEFYPIYNVSVNHYNTNDWYSGTLIPGSTTVNYNEITTYNNQAYYNQTNQNILPFYDTISNNEEFTAAYTGWLLFMTTSDLSESLEIWTDYNFYDHDTIYIDNRIQNVNSSVQQGTSEINSSVQTMTNTINEDLTSTQVNENDVSINTSSMNTDFANNANNFIFTLMTLVKDTYSNIGDTVYTLIVPIPKTGKNITLTSDLISKHIINTWVYSTIQLAWTFVIGMYYVKFVYRIGKWLASGEVFTEHGVSNFLDYLSKENEVITSQMM